MTDTNPTYDFPAGEILLIDKPAEWTSFDVVNKIRRSISRETGIKKIKVGHAGTLDPLATGLLILCTGKFTKRIQELQDLEKEYTGTMILGATTPSLDAETKISQHFPTKHIDAEMIQTTIKQNFLGTLKQVPPSYSAIKVGGVRSYHRARNDDAVQLSAREIKIKEFKVLRFRLPEITFRISCSKGTYIRALARDLGKALNSGGYLGSLRRTRIGGYAVEDAQTLDEFLSTLSQLKLKNTDNQKNSI